MNEYGTVIRSAGTLHAGYENARNAKCDEMMRICESWCAGSKIVVRNEGECDEIGMQK